MALTKPFAENGDKTPIELNPQADGSVSYENGFGVRYSMPIKAVIDSGGNITKTGGLQIQRPQMNQILYDLSSAIIENQENTGDLSNLQTNAKDNLVNAINENFNNKATLLKSAVKIEVGDGYKSLEEALEIAYSYYKGTGRADTLVTLELQSDITINNSLYFYNGNFSYISITSKSAKDIKTINVNSGYFIAGFSGNIPHISNLRIVGKGKEAAQTCIILRGGGIIRNWDVATFTIENFATGLVARQSTSNLAAKFLNCRVGANAYRASVLDLENSTFENCDLGVSVDNGGIVNIDNCTFTNNTTNYNIPLDTLVAKKGIIFS